LRVNRKTSLLAAFAHHLQRIKSAVHVEVPDFQARDLRTAEPDLQTNGKNGPVTNAEQGTWIRRVENRAGLLLRKGQRHALTSIDYWSLDIAHRVYLRGPKLHEVRKQTGKRCQAPAHGRCFFPLLFAHEALPGHDRAVIDLAQLFGCLYAKGTHEVC